MQEKTAGGTPAAPIKLDVSVRVIEPVKNLMGFASVKFNDCFVVENLKIVQGSKGLFLGMPSQPDGKGGYRDMAYPVTKEPAQDAGRPQAGLLWHAVWIRMLKPKAGKHSEWPRDALYLSHLPWLPYSR